MGIPRSVSSPVLWESSPLYNGSGVEGQSAQMEDRCGLAGVVFVYEDSGEAPRGGAIPTCIPSADQSLSFGGVTDCISQLGKSRPSRSTWRREEPFIGRPTRPVGPALLAARPIRSRYRGRSGAAHAAASLILQRDRTKYPYLSEKEWSATDLGCTEKMFAPPSPPDLAELMASSQRAIEIHAVNAKSGAGACGCSLLRGAACVSGYSCMPLFDAQMQD